MAELLDRAHKAGGKALSESWFDAMMALMDFVAWAGYLALPITYFYQDEAIYREYLSIYPGKQEGAAQAAPWSDVRRACAVSSRCAHYVVVPAD